MIPPKIISDDFKLMGDHLADVDPLYPPRRVRRWMMREGYLYCVFVFNAQGDYTLKGFKTWSSFCRWTVETIGNNVIKRVYLMPYATELSPQKQSVPEPEAKTSPHEAR